MQAKLKEIIHTFILNVILQQFYAKVKKENGQGYKPI